MGKYNNFQDYITDNFIHYNGREESDFEDDYNEILDMEGTVKVGGIEFWPSTILKECDPIAYSCGLTDYVDGVCKDGSWIEENGNYYSPEEHQRATDDWDDSNSDDDEIDEHAEDERMRRENNLKGL